ncbi:MAG: low molecular weight protein-tyrosine-phosphatase [Corynebacterium sp.]|nr:low molecular weight protein-tyrosine-phosphatase [Corynebacterium sp.]
MSTSNRNFSDSGSGFASTSSADHRVHICFVCTGNICRSPMAEVIVHDALADASLDTHARTSSCGIGGWHIGEGADPRTVTELGNAGHDGTAHRAAQFGPEHADADLFVALDKGHVRDLQDLGVSPASIRLLRSFDTDAPEDAEVADPYYGTAADFVTCRQQIEAAIPGLIAWVRQNMTS